MEDKATPLETLLDRAEDFSKTSIKLLKFKTIDRTAEIISTTVSWIVVVAVVALFFMILNIGIALWIGELLGKSYYGFFLVSGFYALLGIVILLFSGKWIRKPIRNSIISQLIN